MNYLLDTHVFLWFIKDDPALNSKAKTLIEEPENSIYFSIASMWEMAIKVSLGKLQMPSPFNEFVQSQLIENKVTLLDIKTRHTEIVATMPFHHRDPFDRMLICQAMEHGLMIATVDDIFQSYAISLLKSV